MLSPYGGSLPSGQHGRHRGKRPIALSSRGAARRGGAADAVGAASGGGLMHWGSRVLAAAPGRAIARLDRGARIFYQGSVYICGLCSPFPRYLTAAGAGAGAGAGRAGRARGIGRVGVGVGAVQRRGIARRDVDPAGWWKAEAGARRPRWSSGRGRGRTRGPQKGKGSETERGSRGSRGSPWPSPPDPRPPSARIAQAEGAPAKSSSPQ